MSQRCEAIILRRTRFSESSLVVALLTREHGRIDALAKGCRRLKSPMRGHMDLYSLEDILIYPRAKGGLDLVTETHVLEEYMVLRKDPLALAAAGLAGETLLAGCMLRDPHPGAFDALASGLAAMQSGGSPAALACGMLLATLRELGFSPRIDACADCGAALEPRTDLALCSRRGGLVCPACAAGGEINFLSIRQVSILRRLAQCSMQETGRLRLPAGEWLQLLHALAAGAEHALSRALRSKRIFATLLGVRDQIAAAPRLA